MTMETRLYYYALGAGIPYNAVNSIANAVDEIRNASDIGKRRRVAEQVLKDSPWQGTIPKERGYALIGKDTLPGTKAAMEAARAVIEERRKQGAKAKKSNPFIQCERPEDLLNHPALVEFALSDALLHMATDYYGMVPQIKEIGIWLTPPQTRQFGSQLYHLDKPEGKLLKLFINLDDHDASSGPLTILPADVSSKVRRATNYEAIYYRDDGRIADDKVFEICSPTDQVVLGGAAGTGVIADTSNCLHFGSRTSLGERKMLTVSFLLPHKARDRRSPLFDLIAEPKDELRKLVLAGAQFRKG
ncbi:MAG: hypothetical protein AB7V13_25200 [Pseudorhodoplanes sp.]|uniref:hypothetical protein n=1 Tax=Pseudorhodoplanes sp. TaxID=1934341 RepID=UPI003D13534D